MRKITRNTNVFAICDRYLKVYLKLILRKFKKLNQGMVMDFDEVNAFSSVSTTYQEVIQLSVECYKQIAKKTYRWLSEGEEDYFYFEAGEYTSEGVNDVAGPLERSEKASKVKRKRQAEEDDIFYDMWLEWFLNQPNPVTHYIWYDEAERKKNRLYEALLSCRNSADRKKAIEQALRYWTKQFEQGADNIVDEILFKRMRDDGTKYFMWITQKDERVCEDCRPRDGKIYPIGAIRPPLHYHCRCYAKPI